MKTYAFGIDIGGTTIKTGLFETAGSLLKQTEIPTRTEENGKYILEDIVKAIDRILKEEGLAKEDLEGIGVGVPGPVLEDGTVQKCVNLGWGVVNVQETLEKMTGVKVRVGNDANVAALGEMWKGGGAGRKNMVMVTLGTGVGGGVIINEKILPGFNGAGGEIGHLPMCDDEDECCGCGKKGCLEQYASATGIVRMAKRYFKQNPSKDSVLRSLEQYTAKDILDGARQGDEAAVEIKEEVAKMLGKAMAMISCTTNPEAFVIGGGMSKAGDILMDAIKKHYKTYAFHAARDTEITPAKLGNMAGMYGCVRMLLE